MFSFPFLVFLFLREAKRLGQSSRPAAHQGQAASKVQHHTARPAQQSGTTHPAFQGQSSGGSQQDGAAALAVSSNSVSIFESNREVIMLGSSLVPRELVCIEDQVVPVLYVTGSSESIIHSKLRHLCSNIQEREVSLSTANSTLKKQRVETNLSEKVL